MALWLMISPLLMLLPEEVGVSDACRDQVFDDLLEAGHEVNAAMNGKGWLERAPAKARRGEDGCFHVAVYLGRYDSTGGRFYDFLGGFDDVTFKYVSRGMVAYRMEIPFDVAVQEAIDKGSAVPYFRALLVEVCEDAAQRWKTPILWTK